MISLFAAHVSVSTEQSSAQFHTGYNVMDGLGLKAAGRTFLALSQIHSSTLLTVMFQPHFAS